MRTFATTVDIDAPTERVWQVMSDIDRWHEWTPSISSVERVGGKPFAVGCRVVIRQPKFPPAWWTVTAIEPGSSFTWVSTAPGIRVSARHQVEAAAAGSRAMLALEMEGPLAGVFAWMTKDITERYLGLEASGLQARSMDPGFRQGGKATS